MDLKQLTSGLIFDPLPEFPFEQRASSSCALIDTFQLAVANILRYVPQKHYKSLAKEFMTELLTYGHIYAVPLKDVPGKLTALLVLISCSFVTAFQMIPNYSTKQLYGKYFITLINAGRKYLGVNDLSGKVFVPSGLGGMSGAQAKAARICGCIGVIAEVRYLIMWLDVYSDNLDEIIQLINQYRQSKESLSIGYLENIVELWERLADEETDSVDDKSFKYPSYMQDIMGDIFSMGFGPFCWICTSGDANDLKITDNLACEAIDMVAEKSVPSSVCEQYRDNQRWICEADKHQLVVGSQARILYSDQAGRIAISLKFNEAVRCGKLKSGVVINRDHYDVSGTNSPFRETSNIVEGSAYWLSKPEMLSWDVSNGVARRSWSGNRKAQETIKNFMDDDPELLVTLPNQIDISELDIL
uniref:HET domain-containing protein n=1 Tax=Syphacia muris TaxID=451379 RepID=A0A158R5C0_9BILA